MGSSRNIGAALALAGCCAGVQAAEGAGLKTEAIDWPRWQGRLSLSSPSPSLPFNTPERASQGLGSLRLMGDYYLSGSLLGPQRAGGFRATSGLLIGPRTQLLSGNEPGTGGVFSINRSVFGQSPVVAPGESYPEAATLPYIGLGYTGLSPRGRWSFNADLGLVSLDGRGGVKLGRVFTGSQSLEETVRDMRWSPVLQLGVSYSF